MQDYSNMDPETAAMAAGLDCLKRIAAALERIAAHLDGQRREKGQSDGEPQEE